MQRRRLDKRQSFVNRLGRGGQRVRRQLAFACCRVSTMLVQVKREDLFRHICVTRTIFQPCGELTEVLNPKQVIVSPAREFFRGEVEPYHTSSRCSGFGKQMR